MHNTRLFWWFIVLLIFLAGYSFFSYSLTDPNLVLTSWSPYWQFQNWMWQVVFSNKPLTTHVYIFLILGLFCSYLAILFELAKTSSKLHKKHVYAYSVVLAVLFFSYNALSHDVFNYIFNAKIALTYQDNPHVYTALQYPDDLWIRFMHNTHTPAPYGYGWTALSIIPFVLGAGKFITTWLMFRVVNILGVWLLYKAVQYLSRVIFNRDPSLHEWALLFLNPLFLLEVVSNVHNDIWMMIPAIYLVALFLQETSFSWKRLVLLFGLLLSSVSIKFVTVLLLIPLGLVWLQDQVLRDFLQKNLHKLPFSKQIVAKVSAMSRNFISSYVPILCSLILFVPLFTSRSQFFHPWYLLWSLCWIPVIKQKWWRVLLIAFSFSSLIRYAPWLYQGGFDQHTLQWQQLTTWCVAVLVIFIWFCISSLVSRKTKLTLYND